MPKESKECTQIEEASPTTGSPPHSFEQPTGTPISHNSPHITIGSESMQVDNTNMTVDRTEDPFKYFATSIVGNIVDYNSSSNEEKDQKPKEDDAPSENKIESSIEEAISSVPLPVAAATPSTPPTQATVAAIKSDEEDEVQNLISSLSKFLEKKILVKSIENTLTSILDRTKNIVSPIDTPTNIQ